MDRCTDSSPFRTAVAGALALTLMLGLLAMGGCDIGGVSPSDSTDGDPRRAGGDLTIFSVSNLSFSNPGPGLSEERLALHNAGDQAFEDSFVSAPAAVLGGLGPAFVRNSCEACHARDGRAPGEQLLHLSMPGTDAHGGPVSAPGFGIELQHSSIFGTPAEGNLTLQWAEEQGKFADGTTYTLRRPEAQISDPYTDLPSGLLTSLRMPRPVFGLGLLEAVPDATLRDLADEQAATDDGISGEPNVVWNRATQQMDIGRFGWKASQPSLLQQNAEAYNRDMGVTNPLFPVESTAGQPGFEDGLGDDPEITQETLDEVTFYVQTLAVPARRNLDDAVARRGEQLFADLSCATCHQPRLRTGSQKSAPETQNQIIYPYTDMLLHNMGPALADDRDVFEASGQEWRTPPLWGIGLTELVNGEPGFLHDGRARTLTEAILWHGGEAKAAREGFKQLSEEERDALIAFLKSL